MSDVKSVKRLIVFELREHSENGLFLLLYFQITAKRDHLESVREDIFYLLSSHTSVPSVTGYNVTNKASKALCSALLKTITILSQSALPIEGMQEILEFKENFGNV